MATEEIRFDDGAAYERYMGVWSRAVGEQFLDWLAPAQGLRWLDVGCGNGAFTQMLAERCAPSVLEGIDPSAEQLAYARTRPALRTAKFQQADAMSLPFAPNTFDAAVMPLVIFFVPVPAKGVAEMTRVVRPGGTVSAYGWDLTGGGFPYESLREEMTAMGFPVPMPPSPDAARLDILRDLWTNAGLADVQTQELTVQRTFTDFDDYWTTILGGPSVGASLKKMTADDRTRLQSKMRTRLTTDADGRITYKARANAVKGKVASK